MTIPKLNVKEMDDYTIARTADMILSAYYSLLDKPDGAELLIKELKNITKGA